ncbi:hypothetical protein [Chroococcidiopsis sp.]|uniref:hypothetical protein n=1 Tax=Chroococcidiopsis sp. TaxID=3088168 RepID=UPI003F3F6FE0
MRLLPPPPSVAGVVVCTGGRELLQLTISKQHRLSRLRNFPHDQNCRRDKPNQFIFFLFDLANYQEAGSREQRRSNYQLPTTNYQRH